MIITTYAELEEFYKKIDYLRFIIVLSKGGLGKTTLLKESVGSVNVLNTHLTTLAFYKRLYELKNQIIGIDDLDKLLNREGISKILKQLCDTKPVRRLQWNSTTSILSEQGIPKEFETNSAVIVTLNELKRNSANIKAILDRAFVIVFKPTKKEVLNKLLSFSNVDYEVVEEMRKSRVETSLRTYIKLVRLKNAGLFEEMKDKVFCGETPFTKWYESNILNCDTEEDLVKLFFKKFKRSRATFFRWKKKLK